MSAPETRDIAIYEIKLVEKDKYDREPVLPAEKRFHYIAGAIDLAIYYLCKKDTKAILLKHAVEIADKNKHRAGTMKFETKELLYDWFENGFMADVQWEFPVVYIDPRVTQLGNPGLHPRHHSDAHYDAGWHKGLPIHLNAGI